ncbi:SRPBCC domain-containing protein [Agilicoccus flavus]|uniref:SRPBCC domain-containing protein n=1 Tax=Agilicoccus flavus TaxID=2775968 RepID=UPI001CF651B7|nr:SRPBCC domain-containing protein [Agilicoccus flavus]
MNITGTCHMDAPVAVAWDAFHDPGVLERTIPGVKSLRRTGDDAYDLVVSMGVASIKGTYEGKVALTEQVEHESFVLAADGAGAAGTIGAKVAVRLAEAGDGGTDIAFDADAIVGGAVGGVGQRMLAGVARRVAAQFFAAIDRDIARGGAAPESTAAGETAVASVGASEAPASSTPEEAPAEEVPVAPTTPRPAAAPTPATPGQVPFWVVLAGVGTGAACTLAGVTLGWVAARGTRR